MQTPENPGESRDTHLKQFFVAARFRHRSGSRGHPPHPARATNLAAAPPIIAVGYERAA